MHLCIDIGNTRTKWGVFDAQHAHQPPIAAQRIAQPLTPDQLRPILRSYPITHAILSSVVHHDPAVAEYLEQYTQLIQLNHTTPLPIVNGYATPHTLGNDRLASVVGGNYLHPKSDILVIDAGTCIKYDFIDQHAHYWGGGISPGFTMRLQALHHFTQKLPLLALPTTLPPLIANNTQAAMLSGAINGAIAEVSHIIAQYAHLYPQLRVVLSGGNAACLLHTTALPLTTEPHLILYGLYKILVYNVDQNL